MKVFEYIFPQNVKCIFCGRETECYAVCKECYDSLPWIKGSICEKCGGRVMGEGHICLDCKDSNHIFNRIFCAFDYDGDMRNKIIEFKQGGRKYIGETFSHLLYEYFKTIDIPFDIIIPMPIHENRVKDRGFNQCEILLSEIKENYGRTYSDVIIRSLDTPHQTGLSKVNRIHNLDGAFKVVRKDIVKGKVVLIIDDIYTTGSTMDECARTLYKAKAKAVYGLCLSRALNNKTDYLLY